MTIAKLLVANRGEIAQRVIRTAQDLGIATVAVFADPDRNSGFVRLADEAWPLGGTALRDTYLAGEKIVEIARRADADAVHPGYGFLSEEADFARLVADSGLTWIGPEPRALEALGDKINARRLAERVGVAPVPGTSEPVTGRETVDAFVAEHGFPIVTKRADGGGGRGIQVHRSPRDLDAFFAATDGRAESVFLERFIEDARHIETQAGRDAHGTIAIYSTRDCSVQRRHQKLIEEAPAPALPDGVEARLRDWTGRLLESVDYRGLGTVEFLVEPSGRIAFLEVNPRLQVEHPVTEEVTGIDLVAEQLRIASGKPLTEPSAPRGHAIELRITCEDPAAGMMPSTGTIDRLVWPTGHGVRVESGVDEGDAIGATFDPMLAKLIITGPDRPAALARCQRALRELEISGIATPIGLYREVLRAEDFSPTCPTTRWFETEILPAYAARAAEPGTGGGGPDDSRAAGRPGGSARTARMTPTAHSGSRHRTLDKELRTFVVEVEGRPIHLGIPTGLIAPDPEQFPAVPGRRPQPRRGTHAARRADTAAGADNEVRSPIQAIVVRTVVGPGDRVREGDLLLVLEAMKMESYVTAPRDGVVEAVTAAVGTTVAAGQILVTLGRVPEREEVGDVA